MANCEDATRQERKGDVGEVVEEFRARARGLFPPEFRRHMLGARREFLLAVRSLIDARLEDIEREEKASSKKATKVTIE